MRNRGILPRPELGDKLPVLREILLLVLCKCCKTNILSEGFPLEGAISYPTRAGEGWPGGKPRPGNCPGNLLLGPPLRLPPFHENVGLLSGLGIIKYASFWVTSFRGWCLVNITCRRDRAALICKRLGSQQICLLLVPCRRRNVPVGNSTICPAYIL